MWCKIALVSVLLQLSFGFDISENDNPQALVQLARVEQPGFWTFVEDSSSNNPPIPFNRLGRKLFKLPQTLIPYPRTGRMLFDTDILDYEESLMPEVFSWHNLADGSMADFFMDGKTLIPKRANAAFPPRFGRKKRSISDEDQMEHDDSEREQDTEKRSPSWYNFADIEPDYFLRQDRKPKSKNSFVPRVGKKRSSYKSQGMEEISEKKRAKVFQPRVGRVSSSLFSKFAESAENPRGIFQVKSRGAFIPRVGRRAAFVPRMGKRAKFLPRVGRQSGDDTE